MTVNKMINSRLFGGWLTVLETREEWACIEHWVENAYEPSFQRFAISGQILYEYEGWATSHPQDGHCVSMMIGDGVDHAGQWLDVQCHGATMWGICEMA